MIELEKILPIALVFVLIQTTLSNALLITPSNTMTVSNPEPFGIINEPLSNRAPLASFTYTPSTIRTTWRIDFSDNSYDPDGTIVSWYWNFGDGGTSTSQSPSHTYTTVGTYTTSLTVTDNNGAGSTYTLKYNVQDVYTTNAEPSASAMCKLKDGVEYACLDGLTIRTNDPIQFIDYSKDFYDNDAITSWYWNFGDGTISTEKNPTHHYFLPGHYHIALIATDNRGGSGAWFASLTITTPPANNHPPVANADPDLTEADVGKEVGFIGYNSYDPDNDVLTYSWQFGDGGTATGSIVKYTYTTAGTYSVVLTVSDGLATDSDTVTAKIGVSPRNELSVSEIKLLNNYLSETDKVEYNYTIVNSGDSDLTNVRVLNFIQDYGEANEVHYKYDYISIQAKTTKTINTNLGFMPRGLAKLSVFVDDDKKIAEMDENNNIMNNSFAVHGKIDYVKKKVLDHFQFESSFSNGRYETKSFTISGKPKYLEIDFFSFAVKDSCQILSDWSSTFNLIDPNGVIYQPTKIDKHQEIQIENPTNGLWRLEPRQISGKNSPMVEATIRTYVDSELYDATIPIDKEIFLVNDVIIGCDKGVWSGEATLDAPDVLEVGKTGPNLYVNITTYKNPSPLLTSILASSKTEMWIEGQDKGPFVEKNPVVYVDDDSTPTDYGIVYNFVFSGVIGILGGKEIALAYSIVDIALKLSAPPKEGTVHEKNYAYANSDAAGYKHEIQFPMSANYPTGFYHVSIISEIEPFISETGHSILPVRILVPFEYPIKVVENANSANISDDMIHRNLPKPLPVPLPSAK